MNARTGTLTRNLDGRFSKWKKGEKVKVDRAYNGIVTIERIKWKGTLVPLTNRLTGVPEEAIKFDLP